MDFGLPGEYIILCQPIGRVHIRWAAFIVVTIDCFLSLFAFMYECAIYGVGGNAGKFYAALFFFILKVTFSTVFYVFWSKERSLKAKFTLKKVRLYLWPVFIHNLVVAVALVIIIGAIAVRMGNADRSYHAETAYQNDILISGLVLMFVSVILFLSKTIAAYLIWRYYMFIVNQLIVQEDIEGEELTEMQV